MSFRATASWASTAGVEPALSGFVDRRLDPFGHVDRCCVRATSAGTCTRDLRGLTDRRFHWLSYGGSVRALGLEPSLILGKGPVPYQSGVDARIDGPGGNRTPCVG